MNPPAPRPSHTLILHAGALGDLILTLHFLRLLKRVSPRHVTLVGRGSWAAWAKRAGFVDAAVEPHRIGLHALFEADPSRFSDLGAFLSGFRDIFSFLGEPEDEVTLRLRRLAPEATVTGIDPRPTALTLSKGRHIVEQWWSEASGTSDGALNLNASIEGVSSEPPNTLWSPPQPGESRRLVWCHPGSGGRAKCVSPDVMEALAARLTEAGYAPRWMLGPDEIEQFGHHLIQRLSRSAEVLFELDPDLVTAHLQQARVYIGMDSGMTHVAALLGVPTVAVFGPTDPRVWRPLGPRVHIHGFPPAERSADRWVCEMLQIVTSMPPGHAAG